MRSNDSNNFRQRRSLSQVFLRENWPCVKMATKVSEMKVRRVLEIGPGNGILTRELLKAGLNVTAVEKDARFAEKMDSFAKQAASSGDYPGKLRVYHINVLKFDLEAWLNEDKEPKAICGNIPYNISSPILFWLLPYIDQLKIACLLVQKEFAERLASAPLAKSYGSLSVFTQLRTEASIDFKVNRSCFYPIPRVDSAAVCLVSKKQKYSQEQLNKVEVVTRQAFMQRRKKLSNSLSTLLKNVNLNDIPFDFTRRCDSLTPEEFVALAQQLVTDEQI